MDPPAGSRERLHGRSTCAEQGRTQSDSRSVTTRHSGFEGQRCIRLRPSKHAKHLLSQPLRRAFLLPQVCWLPLKSYRSSLAKSA
jgi:hypothetical protein